MFRIIPWLKRQQLWVKILVILLILAILAGVMAFIAYFVGLIFYTLDFRTLEKQGYFYYALNTIPGKFVTFALWFAVIVMVLSSIFTNNKNKVDETDERGIHYMKEGTHGSSRWMKNNEIKNVFEFNNIRNTTTTIYGQLDDKGKQAVGYKKKTDGASLNRNTLVIASMGSGKSYCYVRTELVQSVLRGDSFVVTDPSSELFTDLAYFCKNNGYDVKVLNLADPNHSEFWNVLEETIDPETGRLDSTRLNDFVNIYMTNSGSDKKDYWYDSALNLLKAVIGYTAWVREKDIIALYQELYCTINKETKMSVTAKSMGKGHMPFVECENRIRAVAIKNGFDLNELEEIFLDIRKHGSTHPYTLGEVFKNLLHFDTIEDAMKEGEETDKWHPAYIAYQTYKTNDKQEVRRAALQGTLLRFQLFSDNKIREIVSHEGIHLSDINKKKSAYFVITSDKSTSTKPIASLFFSFLFKDVQDVFDKQAQISKENGTPNPCLNVVAMLDEFYSIGVIGGSPDAFGVTMSNSRKRNIFVSIIVQAYQQLEALYGENIKGIIQGNCSTILYLGGNDPETCKFISEFASGETTVLSESHNKLGGIYSPESDSEYSVRSVKRFLLTSDEARRWKNQVLVVKQGEYPLKINPFPWTTHYLYNQDNFKPASVIHSIPDISERLQGKYNEEIFENTRRLQRKIVNFKSNNYNISYKEVFNVEENVDVEGDIVLDNDFISLEQQEQLIKPKKEKKAVKKEEAVKKQPNISDKIKQKSKKKEEPVEEKVLGVPTKKKNKSELSD